MLAIMAASFASFFIGNIENTNNDILYISYKVANLYLVSIFNEQTVFVLLDSSARIRIRGTVGSHTELK